MALRCTVVTPDAQLFDDAVAGAVVPAHDGLIGIQPGHSPLLLRIGAGPLTLHQTGKADFNLFIAGGVAQVKDDVLTILTDQASEAGAIDKEAARRELDTLLAGGKFGDDEAGKIRRRRIETVRAMLAV